MQMNVK